MGLPLLKPRFDADAYLAWETDQTDKSEYVAGEVFAMVGVRRTHATVALNIGAALRTHLRGSSCLPFISDMKLRVASADAFYYPDVMVTCDARDRRADLFIEHGKLPSCRNMCWSMWRPGALKCFAVKPAMCGCFKTTGAHRLANFSQSN